MAALDSPRRSPPSGSAKGLRLPGSVPSSSCSNCWSCLNSSSSCC